MIKFLKRFFCKHKKMYYKTILEDVSPGVRKTHHIWKCSKCGKEFW